MLAMNQQPLSSEMEDAAYAIGITSVIISIFSYLFLPYYTFLYIVYVWLLIGIPIVFTGVGIVLAIKDSTCKKTCIPRKRYYCFHTNTWFKSTFITNDMYREYLQCI
jgi:hypothetical protein